MKSTGYLFKEGIKSLWKNRTMSIASIAVLVSCLLLTGIAILVSLNMESTMKSIEGNNSVTVYLKDGVPQLETVQIGEKLRHLDNIATCGFIAKDDALKNIMEGLGDDGTILNGLNGSDNFLPDAFEISMKDLTKYDDTIAEIKAMDGVEKCTDYSDIADKLNNLDVLIRYCSIGLVAILGVVSLFIISNTVKVTMFSRRVEINIMKSVGATNWFVRIPFIVEGMLIGLISGAVSGTILFFAYEKVTQAIAGIVPFLSIVDISPYSWYIFGGYATLGALFGLMGGIISIGRYLKREGENAIA
ncbi:MAG: permease-like cell division protein FtsX [Oscillospiraceae bacterium]